MTQNTYFSLQTHTKKFLLETVFDATAGIRASVRTHKKKNKWKDRQTNPIMRCKDTTKKKIVIYRYPKRLNLALSGKKSQLPKQPVHSISSVVSVFKSSLENAGVAEC